jgi:hypothetical protein
MRHKTACSCSQILDKARLPMLERARRLSRLQRAVLQLLPADLAAHCKVLNLKNEILVLAAPSPAWAGRLRFATADLIKQLKCQFSLEVRQVDLKIQQENLEIQPVVIAPLHLSMRSATLLAETAKTVNHPPLQEALLRLAAKTREI